MGSDFETFSGSLSSYVTEQLSMPDVQQQVNAIEQDYGIDSMLLFYLTWLAREGYMPDEAFIKKMISLARVWQKDIVQPLTMVRDAVKSTGEQDIRGVAKSLENSEWHARRAELFALLRSTMKNGWPDNSQESDTKRLDKTLKNLMQVHNLSSVPQQRFRKLKEALLYPP